jgi:hypothetical protein
MKKYKRNPTDTLYPFENMYHWCPYVVAYTAEYEIELPYCGLHEIVFCPECAAKTQPVLVALQHAPGGPTFTYCGHCWNPNVTCKCGLNFNAGATHISPTLTAGYKW